MAYTFSLTPPTSDNPVVGVEIFQDGSSVGSFTIAAGNVTSSQVITDFVNEKITEINQKAAEIATAKQEFDNAVTVVNSFSPLTAVALVVADPPIALSSP